MESLDSWDPNEWEEHVHSLLSDRHGPLEVQPVPARHKGDWGVDYYSLSAGAAYQCYAVQEPCTVSDRASKQISKITGDLAKFCNNRKKLSALFGETVIDRWALIVPIHDSVSVNVHLTKKAADVRSSNLPYTSANFQALIQCPKSFTPDSVRAAEARRLVQRVIGQQATSDERRSWAANQISLVKNLQFKLAKRVPATGSIDEGIDETIGWFLTGQNLLETLRGKAPFVYDQVSSAISQRLEILKFAGPPTATPADLFLRSEFDGLKSELRKVAPTLSEENIHIITIGALAEWLLRCPLDFPPYV